MKVLIVGAGSGGLALAAYLRRDGHSVTIVERQRDYKQAGFVIGLWSNCRHTLEPFAVIDRLQQVSFPINEEIVRDQTGRSIAKIDYQTLAGRFGPVFFLLLADLHAILRDLAAGIPLLFETTVRSLEEQQQCVLVTLDDGSQEAYDLVVGADGTHSQVRTLLFGREGCSYSGLRLWFSMLPASGETLLEPNDLFGKDAYIGVFPTRGEQVAALFLASAPAGEPDHPGGRIVELRERFSCFGWRIPDILSSLQDPATIFATPVDQVTLKTWYRGRVVLMGDAAHAVSPAVAMGGAMALEDAHVLAEELRQVDTPLVEQALARYVARRKPRVAQAHNTSDFLLWLAAVHQPVVAFVRNTVMHYLPSSFLLQGFGPILEMQA